MTRAPIAVALDGPDLETITAWASAAGPSVSTMKVGLETFLRDGAAAVLVPSSSAEAEVAARFLPQRLRRAEAGEAEGVPVSPSPPFDLPLPFPLASRELSPCDVDLMLLLVRVDSD